MINDLSRSLPGSPTFAPHVTLLAPVALSVPVWEVMTTLQKAINDASSRCSLRGLQLELQPAQGGSHYFQSVLAPITPTDPLLILRRACEDAFSIHRPTPYFPHLSLLYGDITDQERSDIADRVNRENRLPSAISVEEVVLVKALGKVQDWEIACTVNLVQDG